MKPPRVGTESRSHYSPVKQRVRVALCRMETCFPANPLSAPSNQRAGPCSGPSADAGRLMAWTYRLMGGVAVLLTSPLWFIESAYRDLGGAARGACRS